jgi:molybdopterin/thiamine biosynthesis adenylyltransferase
MALAKFFDKSALAASHILRGFNTQAFHEKLETAKVAVSFDKSAEDSTEGRWTLALTINLLARLYPKIGVFPPKGSVFVDELVKIAKSINPEIEIQDDLTSTACIVVGKRRPRSNSALIFIGSDGWITKVSTKSPLNSGNGIIPFGAYAAACIGVSNVFRFTFGDQLEDGRADEYWQMSLFDFDPQNGDPANPAITDIDFGETHLVGSGAIGNGCVMALSPMRGLSGILRLIDHEKIDLGNLQRYVLARDEDVKRLKVNRAKELLNDTGLSVHAHPQTWAAYLTERNNWVLRRVAVAVDTANARQSVQAALPEWIVNAWTQAGDLGISRHQFLGDQACLACLYLSTGPTKNEDELVAASIGLPCDFLLVRKMLVTNEPVGAAFLGKIAAALKIEVEGLRAFEGQSLRSFYSQAACGGVLLRLGANAPSQALTEVPMAFQSALAGIFLAAELVAKAAGLKNCPPPVLSKIDLLRPLGPYVSFPETKHRAGNCFCQDEDYIQTFKRKYGL